MQADWEAFADAWRAGYHPAMDKVRHGKRGFNNVDLAFAEKMKITVMRVPAYSPASVAEHAVALMLTLNRNIHHAYSRVREGNFDLSGLVGFNMAGKTVGIVGTGKIGTALAHIMKGFGCRLLGYDTYNNPACLELGMKYVDLPCLLAESDIVSLHCPAYARNPTSHQLRDDRAHEMWIDVDKHGTGSAYRYGRRSQCAEEARPPLVSRDRRL
jgi:lactate dehydrogenase-like 2-hydroxyacid dehydrogenase